MKELLTNLLEALGMAWWIEIVNENPECTYYFGPYGNKSEALAEEPGFIEDLEKERAKIVSCTVKRTKPNEYTIYDEAMDFRGSTPRPVFSGQS